MPKQYEMKPGFGNRQSSSVFTDDTPMPFGKFKGKRLGDVKPDYLLWLWDNGMAEDTGKSIHAYIKQNFKRLETTAEDYIPNIAKRPQR
jgi:uncharacterized protein (DUF3820 family)